MKKARVLRNSEDRLLADLKAYIELSKLSPSTLGLNALGDPNFVGDVLSKKRQLTPRKYDALIAYIDKKMAEAK